MLILLSSGARRRYRDDIVRALAHPGGTYLRFRYGSEYVEPSILNEARRGKLTDRKALICHLANQAEGKPALLVPCRFAAIAGASMVGTSLVLTLAAEAYVQQLDDAVLRGLMNTSEKAVIPAKSSDGDLPGGKFAFSIDAHLTANAAPEAAGMTAFERTTEALRAAGFGVDEAPMAFYAIRQLIQVTGKFGQKDPAIVPQKGRYTLQSGNRYALDVYSYSPDGDENPSEASTLRVEADDGDVKFSSETTAKLDSRYDLNRFRFSVEQRIAAVPTGLRLVLGVPILVDGKTVQEDRCDVTLEVLFESSNWLTAVRVGVIAVGTAGPAALAAMVRPEWTWGLGAAMLIPAFFAAWATVIPSLKKS